MQVKLNPTRDSNDAHGKINFPGFQEIYDFTATGSESSASVTVSGNSDIEYLILMKVSAGLLRLNADSGSNYGYQYVLNNSGTISAGRAAYTSFGIVVNVNGITPMKVVTPSGYIKTMVESEIAYSSGTTLNQYTLCGQVWNNTGNVTSLDFSKNGGINFASGERITVYARRSNV